MLGCRQGWLRRCSGDGVGLWMFWSAVLFSILLVPLAGEPAWGEEEDRRVYSDDPLGLVVAYNVTTHYSLDEDVWDVWICEVPEGTIDISVDETVELLQAEVAPYFVQLSGGRYRPTFRVGGVIEAEAFDNWGGCNGPVAEAAGRLDPREQPEGAIVIVNKPVWASFGGIGGVGYPSPVEVSLGTTTFPANVRDVLVGGEAVVDSSRLPPGTYFDSDPPILSTIAHEMGHAIGFPHSYRYEEYDDPMDVMSLDWSVPDLQLGTITFNRYAAGWIDPADVVIYSGGTERYTLAAPGASGSQMLVIRGDDSGFITLGVRVRMGADVGILKEGVESYYIDQQPKWCYSYPRYRACFGTERVTQAITDPNQPFTIDTGEATSHIMEAGDGYTWDRISVRVVERVGNSFVVEVSDRPIPPQEGLSDKDDDTEEFASRNEELYKEDPLGLITAYDVHTHYTLGDDILEVWVCKTPQGLTDLAVEEAVGLLHEKLVPYFEWLSGGRYRPVFRVGGTIELESFADVWDCENAAAATSKGMTEGAIVIADYVEQVSIGSVGFINILSSTEIRYHDTEYSDSSRSVFLGIQTVAEPGSLPPELASARVPVLATAAHEIGHALGFPHSYRITPYDHAMDIMGNTDEIGGLQVGTIAINRYAAGWMDVAEVEIYDGGWRMYRLQPLGAEGTQMLVLPTEGSGYLTLGTRVRKAFDSGIPREGVESYYIDQEAPGCLPPADFKGYEGCHGSSRPTRAFIQADQSIPDATDPVAHVMEVGGGYTWEGIAVSVIDRIGDSFIVEVDDGSDPLDIWRWLYGRLGGR